MEERHEIVSNSNPPLTKNQKRAFWGLIVFSILVFVLQYFQFRNQILSPFDYEKQLAKKGQTIKKTGITESGAIVNSNQDTDKDGLLDADELEIYGTSPYLDDTDSDGFLDGEEVRNGTDPNCLSGQVCGSPEVEITENSTSSSSVSENNGAQTTDQVLQQVLSGGSDPATLRQLLLSGGMDKAILDQISDSDLMASYEESLNTPASTVTATSTNQ